MLKNPAAIFSTRQRSTALAILAVLNVGIIVTMQVMGQSLNPHGIIAFEFAGDVGVAQEMIRVWANNGVLNTLSFLIGFDYAFMVAYSSFLWLACLQIAYRMSGKFSNVIIVLAWLQPVAAMLDATENIALYQMAGMSLENVWPTLAFACAIPKFAITGLGFVFWAGGSLRLLIQNFRK